MPEGLVQFLRIPLGLLLAYCGLTLLTAVRAALRGEPPSAPRREPAGPPATPVATLRDATGREHPLYSGSALTIGRLATCTLPLAEPTASREHAVLRWATRWCVRARRPSAVRLDADGAAVSLEPERPVPLHEGDTLQVAGRTYRFSAAGGPRIVELPAGRSVPLQGSYPLAGEDRFPPPAAQIEEVTGPFLDDRSANGTGLNGRPMDPGRPIGLRDGDAIEIEGHLFTYRSSERERRGTHAPRRRPDRSRIAA